MTYNSSFQDRAGQAAQAKQKALEQFRSRPPIAGVSVFHQLRTLEGTANLRQVMPQAD